jgi:uncharacterized membrane protein YcaP (DUF421 family)
MDVLIIIFRSVAVYCFIIFAIRFFGKRELAQLSVVDLVFILLISNSVQNAMVGPNTSLVGGLAAAGTLFVINMVLENLFFHSEKASKLIQGEALMLIYHGEALEKHLERAKISMDELEAVVREHGVEKISEVDLAVLEVDGNISVLSDNFQHKTLRKRRAHKIINKNES